MRISDWISDVCSSDLLWDSRAQSNTMRRARTVRRESCWILARLLPWVGRPKSLPQRDCNITIDGSSTIAPICAACRHSAFFRDRKNVVVGKSVSVGVDLGGSCTIQKKKNKLLK